MVLQCAKHFYYKVSGEFLQQDSQSSYSFGKIQNVGEAELFEEKKFSVSLEKDFILYIYIYIYILSVRQTTQNDLSPLFYILIH